MATEHVLKGLHAALERLKAVDRDKLLRRDLGEESLHTRLGPVLKQIEDLAGFVSNCAPGLHDQDVERARQAFTEIANQLEEQTNRGPAEYIQQTRNLLNALQAQLYEALRWKQLASEIIGPRKYAGPSSQP